MRYMRKYRFIFAVLLFAGIVIYNACTSDIAFAADINPVRIDENNFPDPNFRAVISTSDYDRDGNGILDVFDLALMKRALLTQK